MILTRREFVSAMLLLPASFREALGAGAQQDPSKPILTSPNSPFNRAFDFSSLASWETPNSDFFVRSHFAAPEPPRQWVLKVRGSVERELALTLDVLDRMPAIEIPVTLECAGNLVGWGGVSNARWSGVSLAALLKQADIL